MHWYRRRNPALPRVVSLTIVTLAIAAMTLSMVLLPHPRSVIAQTSVVDIQRVSIPGAEGDYGSQSPSISADGRYLAYISRDAGRFSVTLHELASGQTRVLTDTARDESPSFAPNGQAVLYATVQGGRGILGTVSLDGKTRARLSESGVDAREPAWGP